MSVFEAEHLARLVELTDDLVCVGSADGYFFRVSPSWVRLLGYDESTLLERPFLSFVHPEDVAETERRIRRVRRGGRLTRFANRLRNSDGEYRWLRWNVAPAAGSRFAYAIARDITETRDITERLEAQTEKLLATERQLAAEMTRAREVQDAFFPGRSFSRPLIDVAGRCVATSEMSGDFFDWSEHLEGAVSVTVGDVMGKGVSAALLMATSLAVLRSEDSERASAPDPAARLNQTNAALAGLLGRACRFVTAFRGTLSADGQLRYADAGHGLALIRRGDGTFEPLDGAGGLPLGVGRGAPYVSARAMLTPGDVLIVATDGLRDVLDGVGTSGWSRHIAAGVSDWTDADAIADDIVLWAESATAGVGASDDLTVLVAVFRGQDDTAASRLVAGVVVEPQLAAIERADRRVSEALVEAGASQDDVDRFVLACHETLSNIVEHASPDAPIELGIELRSSVRSGTSAGDVPRVVATLRDVGFPFDQRSEAEAGRHDRRRGRGLQLCRALLDRFEYERDGDTNVWRLEMDLAAPSADARASLSAGAGTPPQVAQGREPMQNPQWSPGPATIVQEVGGRIDVANASDVGAALEAALAAAGGAPAVMVVRLAALEFIDSSGLGMLVGLQRAFEERGGRLVLCEVPPQARMALRLTRLEWLLPVFDTLEEATAA